MRSVLVRSHTPGGVSPATKRPPSSPGKGRSIPILSFLTCRSWLDTAVCPPRNSWISFPPCVVASSRPALPCPALLAFAFAPCSTQQGACRVLSVFWEMVPIDTTRALLTRVVGRLASDGASPLVRLAAVEGLTLLLECPASHSVLKSMLPVRGERGGVVWNSRKSVEHHADVATGGCTAVTPIRCNRHLFASLSLACWSGKAG